MGKSLLLLSEEFFLPAKQQLALRELLFTFPLLQLLDPSRDGFVPARQGLPGKTLHYLAQEGEDIPAVQRVVGDDLIKGETCAVPAAMDFLT